MRDGAKTRQRLERAALALFVDKGVAATTVRDIATAAAIAEGTLYRHYPSKDEMSWELFRRHYTDLAQRLDALQAAAPTLRDKLAAMVRHFCALFDQDPVLFSYLLLSQHGHLQRVTEDMPNPVDVVCRVMQAAVNRGELPPQDTSVAAAMVLGLVLQVAVFRIYGRITGPLTPMAGSLTAAALHAVGADGAPPP